MDENCNGIFDDADACPVCSSNVECDDRDACTFDYCADSEFADRQVCHNEPVQPGQVTIVEAPLVASVGQSIQLEALDIGDRNCDLTFAWRFGDGNSVSDSLPVTNHTYSSPGPYKIIAESSCLGCPSAIKALDDHDIAILECSIPEAEFDTTLNDAQERLAAIVKQFNNAWTLLSVDGVAGGTIRIQLELSTSVACTTLIVIGPGGTLLSTVCGVAASAGGLWESANQLISTVLLGNAEPLCGSEFSSGANRIITKTLEARRDQVGPLIENARQKLIQLETLECDWTDRATSLDELIESVRQLLLHLQGIGSCALPPLS